MTLCLPKTFHSPSNLDHSIQYVHLNAGAKNTVLYCYGAGGTARDLTLYQAFITAHPSLSLLCVDRWTQGSNTSRSGPALISELSSITLLLLDSLQISKFSVAAHSAGAYQMLDIVGRAPDRVGHVFPISTHIPAPFTSPQIMQHMCTMPSFLFNSITKLDSTLSDTWAEKLFLRFVGSQKADRDDEEVFVDSKELLEILNQYEPDEHQQILKKERLDLDYRLGYTRIAGVGVDLLTALYVDCPADVTWFTCEADIFFGPASVQRIKKQMKKSKVEVIEINKASHSDIFLRKCVWEAIYERVTK